LNTPGVAGRLSLFCSETDQLVLDSSSHKSLSMVLVNGLLEQLI